MLFRSVRANIFEAGTLEIYRFVPPALLEGLDIDHMEIDDFLGLLAKARYIQEIEVSIIQRGVVDAFGEE